jgi:hypothetical protein
MIPIPEEAGEISGSEDAQGEEAREDHSIQDQPAGEPAIVADHPMDAEATLARRREILDDVPRQVRRRLSEGEETPSSVGEPESESSLAAAWRRTGEHGAGVEMVTRRGAFIAFMQPFTAFFTHQPYKKKNDAMGRNLDYATSDPVTQAGIREARKKEWAKWMKFQAVVPIEGAELTKMLEEGNRIIPTRWVDTDKAFFKRTPDGPYVPPEYKSRLVVRGDMERQEGLRTDSPTCDLSALRLVLSYAASKRLTIQSADITNAYFQGKEIDRLFLVSQPRDDHGLEGIPKEAAMICRVPIYGQTDAGRSLWMRLKSEALKIGWTQSSIYPALFYFQKEGKCRALLGTHVDDMLWAADDEHQQYVDKLLALFDVGKIDSRSFRFCGLEVEQDDDDNITVSARDNTAKLKTISYPKDAKTTSDATPGEIEQLRSVTGSLNWISRQVRPDLSYRTNRLQSNVSGAKRFHLKEANKVVEFAVENRDQGLYFKAGAIDFDTCIITAMSDASWAGDTTVINDLPQKHRSQKACMIMLTNDDLVSGTRSHYYPIHYHSSLIKRLCRSTLHAEAQALLSGVEEGWKVRAALSEMRGGVHDKDWQTNSQKKVKQLWLTDCRSLHDHLTAKTIGKVTDKRVAIDLGALRQDLWTFNDVEQEQLDDQKFHDKIRWIDTSTMIVDCMTKAMKSDDLVRSLKEGVVDLTPTDVSLSRKAKKRAKPTKSEDRSQDDDPAEG